MAVLTGISGMQIGDASTGGSGNIALDIQTRVLRILFDGGFAYQTATIANPAQINAGSVSYQIPEILYAEDYGTGTTQFQKLNSGLVEVPINIRRVVKYTYEQFDQSRLGDMAYVITVIADSVAMTIQNDLNLHFWKNISDQFKASTGTLRTQFLQLQNLVDKNCTTDQAREAIKELQWKVTEISKTFSKLAMGVPKSELMVYLDPFADINIRFAYWNQPNKLGERVVAKDLVGTQIGNGIYYYTDKLLGTNITANQSFSKDTVADLSDYVGFIIHNEAIAMPFNFNSMTQVVDQDNANPRFIAKYQFGFGIIRPWLVYAITKTTRSRSK